MNFLKNLGITLAALALTSVMFLMIGGLAMVIENAKAQGRAMAAEYDAAAARRLDAIYAQPLPAPAPKVSIGTGCTIVAKTRAGLSSWELIRAQDRCARGLASK